MDEKMMKSEILYYLDLCRMTIQNDYDCCLDGSVAKKYKRDIKDINTLMSNLANYKLVKKEK